MTMTTTLSWDDAPLSATATKKTFEKNPIRRLTLKKDESKRIAILSEVPHRVFSHYLEGYGNFACVKFQGHDCPGCAQGLKIQEHFYLNVLVYPNNASPNGDWLTSEANVYLWKFGPKVFSTLRAMKGDWGDLRGYDIRLTCTNDKFQHITPANMPQSLWAPLAAADEKFAERIQNDLYDIPRITAADETPEEIQMILDGKFPSRKELKEYRKSQGETSGETFEQAVGTSPNPGVDQSKPFKPAAPAASPKTVDFNSLLKKKA